MKTTARIPSRPEEFDPEHSHRRQTIWQIFVPGILFLVIIFFIAGLSIYSATVNPGAIHIWGDVSAVALILPLLFGGILVASIAGLLIYGLARILKLTPDFMLLVRLRVFQASFYTHLYADKIVQPFIKINGWKASLKRLRQRIFNH